MNSVGEIVAQIGKERRLLMETESKTVLERWGIATVTCDLATSREEAVSLAHALGFPVVLKVLSPDILHKTEVDGVRLNVSSDEAVRSGYDGIIANAQKSLPSARVLGVTVQKMVSGIEVAVGVANDAQFGPVLMFGMGGVWVELLKDTTFRLIPIDAADAEEMLRDIKGLPLLEGYRGWRADLDGLRNILIKVSDLIMAFPQIEEMDLNPVITSSSGSVVADARISLAASDA
jgi:acyl-CoA synthetase (NDP forming)